MTERFHIRNVQIIQSVPCLFPPLVRSCRGFHVALRYTILCLLQTNLDTEPKLSNRSKGGRKGASVSLSASGRCRFVFFHLDRVNLSHLAPRLEPLLRRRSHPSYNTPPREASMPFTIRKFHETSLRPSEISESSQFNKR
jgi:hypothetical protein